MPLFALAGAIGAALAYFFDPDNGRRRRKELIKRAGKSFRRAGTRAGDAAAQPDDVTLARKVETEIFRDTDVPKGKINVNVEDGVVYLRGELEQPDLIDDLEKQAHKVQGVQGVQNLLHTPGQEAPAKPE